MKEFKFKNKDGFVSLYALGCGYVQRKEVRDKRVELYMEGGCYLFHVRYFNYQTGARERETFELLGPAKKRYFELIKQYLKK